APALRRALENSLSHRKPDVFFIDEAQHMGKMSSGHKLQDQLDCLKSLANMTTILHCLLGTYELLTFRNLSGQLSRRSVDIHFPRYQVDNPDDIQAFKSVLLTFSTSNALSSRT
ncbi:TniB family NTP-binding protein, partial [Cyanothece sp. BG0011]|uniref:TniB family NTP-binding protein n=1 Tax=Cyanothece sp. BG0011 TaxID=2082950 RepID=UPI0018E588A9